MLTPPRPAHRQSPIFLILLTLTLLAIFFVSIYHLTRESMAYDEGWSLWAVRPAETGEMLARVAADVHPPLYFLVLDGWVAQVGESDVVVRLLSVAGALIGAAATFTLGRQLFDRWTGWIALAVLGTTSFFVYYAREARMYSWLFALASLSMWAYWRWRQRPSRRYTLIYALSIAALFYTHYYGLLIVASQVLHLLLVSPKQHWSQCSICDHHHWRQHQPLQQWGKADAENQRHVRRIAPAAGAIDVIPFAPCGENHGAEHDHRAARPRARRRPVHAPEHHAGPVVR